MDLRLTKHNKGKNCNSYTYSRRPVELQYCELFTNFNLAIEWETRIKKWSSKKKIALINSDWKSLIEESRNTIEKLKLLEVKTTSRQARCDNPRQARCDNPRHPRCDSHQ